VHADRADSVVRGVHITVLYRNGTDFFQSSRERVLTMILMSVRRMGSASRQMLASLQICAVKEQQTHLGKAQYRRRHLGKAQYKGDTSDSTYCTVERLLTVLNLQYCTKTRPESVPAHAMGHKNTRTKFRKIGVLETEGHPAMGGGIAL